MIVKPVSIKQIYKEIFFLCTALAAIGLFCQNTRVMYLLIGVNIAARFIFAGRRHDWIFFLIGLIGGGGNDLLSMIKGVYYYTPKDIFPLPIPVWMLFFWGHIFVAFRQLFQQAAFQGTDFGGRPWKLDKRLIADIFTIVILRIIIYRFVKHEPIPTIGYASVIALRMIVLPPGKHEWKLMAVAVPVGWAYEAALIKFGLYVYYNPVFAGMSAWLMLYWTFMIPVFLKGIYDRVEATLAEKDARRDEILRGGDIC